MATVIHILDETPVRLWDLSLRERVRRLMRGELELAAGNPPAVALTQPA